MNRYVWENGKYFCWSLNNPCITNHIDYWYPDRIYTGYPNSGVLTIL